MIKMMDSHLQCDKGLLYEAAYALLEYLYRDVIRGCI